MPGRAAIAKVVLVRGGAEVAAWPFVTGARPDLSSVDRLARLALAARRLGCELRLRDVSPDLARLLGLAGLLVEVGGQPEGGEQPGVEEVVVTDDPVA